MVRRHELTDAQWQKIEALLPANGKPGGQWADHRTVINGVLFRARTGVPWPDLPERYGPWQTVYERHRPGLRRLGSDERGGDHAGGRGPSRSIGRCGAIRQHASSTKCANHAVNRRTAAVRSSSLSISAPRSAAYPRSRSCR
ncbi:hypothetical protein CG747_41900 [Streptomyces sp. CB02959]|nr:hypothetical protein CG747_41900 [Streptomyces sp. CB02959]